MNNHGLRFLRRWAHAALVLGAALLGSVALPAHAAPAVTVEAGLGRYFRTHHWIPVRVNLMNPGAAERVDVRIRVSQGIGPAEQYLLQGRELPAGANERHTFYIRAGVYGSADVTLDLMQNGKSINTVPVRLEGVYEPGWLAVGIGPQTAPLQSLRDVKLPPAPFSSRQPWQRSGPSESYAEVATLTPASVPDRGQGLSAAHMVVLGEVTERELSPEQATALRDYAQAGGTLVICGGANWNRLTTPFFRDLLPLDVRGGSTLGSLPSLRSFSVSRTAPPSGSYPVCRGKLRDDAEILAADGDVPIIATRSVGAGRVVFVAFNPFAPPFRDWKDAGNFWKQLIRYPTGAPILNELMVQDWNGGGMADAPYAIPQLDIPSFYLIVLFLMAYVIVLVPVNYVVLKRLDRRELAWLTTPAIVLLFSAGAYLIGHGAKGGRTLLINAGLVEVAAGEERGPGLFYAGLFSPRKAAYEVRPAEARPGQPTLESVLLSDPNKFTEHRSQSWRNIQSDSPYLDRFAVDMWSMRVVRMDGLISLGGGITPQLQLTDGRLNGTVHNGSRLHLHDCRIIAGGGIYNIPDLPPGQSVSISNVMQQGSFLNSSWSGLLPQASGEKQRDEKHRLREAILTQFQPQRGMGSPITPGDQALLLGWTHEPMAHLEVSRHSPDQTSATLVLVHLDPRQPAVDQPGTSPSPQSK